VRHGGDALQDQSHLRLQCCCKQGYRHGWVVP
jgi:hypothetical protein